MSAGLFTYDRMARVLKEERNQMLNRDEALSMESLLRPEKIYGAAFYYEYLTDDARLVLDCIKAAAALGAVVTNYSAVTSLLIESDHLVGAIVRDELSSAEVPVRAKVVVNAAGPWVDAVRLLQDAEEKQRLRLTKGIHLVVPVERLPVNHCVVWNAPDKRPIFAIRRGKVAYLGTTDTDYEGRYDDPPITVEDANYLLDAANSIFKVDRLGVDDVVGAWAGLRPLLHQEGKKPQEISRKDEIMVGATGLISIAGGKLTTFRKMAERVTDMVVEHLSQMGVKVPEKVGNSEHEPISGGDIAEDVDAFVSHLKQRWARVPEDVVERVAGIYGSNGERMVEAMANDPKLARRCAPAAAVTQSEVAYAVREEMSMTLQDFLERRSRLFLWDVDNGLQVAPEAARLMGDLLGWDAARVESELEDYRQHVREVKAFLSSAEVAGPQKAANA